MDIFEWDENIPVTANNMNEMQNIINGNVDERMPKYNLVTGGSAIKTGRQIDGHDEYVKRVTLTGLPGNNVTKTWASGISMTNLIMTDLIITVKTGANNWFKIPNNDIANSRAQLNANGDISVTMINQGNFNGLNGVAEVYYYYTS